MKTVSAVFGGALLAAILVEQMINFMGKPIPWYLMVLIVLVALALLIYGLWPKRDYSKEIVGIITPEGHKSLEPSIFRRIIDWLRSH